MVDSRRDVAAISANAAVPDQYPSTLGNARYRSAHFFIIMRRRAKIHGRADYYWPWSDTAGIARNADALEGFGLMAGILNYTTQFSADVTIGEIHGLLRRAGARSIVSEFDDDNELSSIAFIIETAFGRRAFKLPANVDACLAVMLRDGTHRVQHKAPPDREQATRVAWRILKDWLEAQLALVRMEMVGLDEIMLPFMATPSGKSVYHAMLDNGLELPMLPSGGRD